MSQKRPTRKKREGSRLYKFHSGLTRPLTAGMLKRMNLPERYWEVSFSKVLDGPFKKYVGKFLVDMGTALSCFAVCICGHWPKQTQKNIW